MGIAFFVKRNASKSTSWSTSVEQKLYWKEFLGKLLEVWKHLDSDSDQLNNIPKLPHRLHPFSNFAQLATIARANLPCMNLICVGTLMRRCGDCCATTEMVKELIMTSFRNRKRLLRETSYLQENGCGQMLRYRAQGGQPLYRCTVPQMLCC
jgi:hypothetical protein